MILAMTLVASMLLQLAVPGGNNKREKVHKQDAALFQREDSKPIRKPDRLTVEATARLQKTTVRIQAARMDGATSAGIGFSAFEPGVIVTDARVLRMLGPNSQPPTTIKLTFNSGTTKEWAAPAEVLGVDSSLGLAVLRAKGSKLPTPLQVRSVAGLRVTETVFFCNFPKVFGSPPTRSPFVDLP